MAGLVVIDFIDMEQSSHDRKVEKAMKEALKHDRARIQVGRISSFGLMEMSRQRLRTGVLEASTKPCPHCDGTGLMRTAASAGLSALRIIEDEAARGRGDRVCLRAGAEAAVYVLNKKRSELAEIEQRYGVSIEILIDEGFEGARMTVDSSGARPIAPPRFEAAPVEEEEDEDDETLEISLEGDEEETEERGEEREGAREGEGERQGRRRRRRRRGGRGRGRRDDVEGEAAPRAEPALAEEQEEPAKAEASAPEPEAQEPEGGKRRRRRGRKSEAQASEPVVEPVSSPMVERPIDEEPPIAATEAHEEPQPKPKRRRSKKADAEPEAAVAEPAPPEAPPAETADRAAVPEKPARKRRTKAKAEPEQPEPVAEESAILSAANNDTAADAAGEPRRGWWQRTFG
jgi:ribonuclease E